MQEHRAAESRGIGSDRSGTRRPRRGRDPPGPGPPYECANFNWNKLYAALVMYVYVGSFTQCARHSCVPLDPLRHLDRREQDTVILPLEYILVKWEWDSATPIIRVVDQSLVDPSSESHRPGETSSTFNTLWLKYEELEIPQRIRLFIGVFEFDNSHLAVRKAGDIGSRILIKNIWGTLEQPSEAVKCDGVGMYDGVLLTHLESQLKLEFRGQADVSPFKEDHCTMHVHQWFNENAGDGVFGDPNFQATYVLRRGHKVR
ncbi:hypothetical protein FB451DRAFT_1189200 [Mycena latifolia]|nr:hypothetical protein FB451DRAFT_1189200 [Mycena latifolia]